MSLIKIKDFHKQYKSHLVQHKSITLHNKITVIKGVNGSGKSTLIKSIIGYLHHNGIIEHDLEIAYMPEQMVLPEHLTISLFLTLMLPKDRYQIKNKLLKLLKLEEHKEKVIHTLSKGMYLKTRLIYTLSLDKDYYILDEPFNGLDDEMRIILKKWILSMKKPFLICTHLHIFNKNECDVITV